MTWTLKFRSSFKASQSPVKDSRRQLEPTQGPWNAFIELWDPIKCRSRNPWNSLKESSKSLHGCNDPSQGLKDLFENPQISWSQEPLKPLDRPLKSLCDIVIPTVHDEVINKDLLFSIHYMGSFQGPQKPCWASWNFWWTLWSLGASQISSQGPWNESWTLERTPSVRWTSSDFIYKNSRFKDSRWDRGGVPWRTLYLTICIISTNLYVVVAVEFAVLNCSICSRRCHKKNFERK